MIEDDLDGAAEVAAEFRRELTSLSEAMGGVEANARGLSGSLTRSLGSALEGMTFDGLKASEAMERVARSVIGTAYRGAMRPVTEHLADAVTRGFGALVPFAKGGVVSQPVAFPMAGATGVAGEAGLEAILPLARGSDGRLGVRASGGAVPVTINIHTPDVESFRRSRSQVAAQVQRMLGAGGRNR